ncbi:hypothetical protein ColTof3_03002 [Colletotrichum tofieldiae]|nr:hypothetical protein ColTof3_03002 [Colletotrichum tofieldiae]
MSSTIANNGSAVSQADTSHEDPESRANPTAISNTGRTSAAVHASQPVLAFDGPDARLARVQGEVADILQRLQNFSDCNEAGDSEVPVKSGMEQSLKGVGKRFE